MAGSAFTITNPNDVGPNGRASNVQRVVIAWTSDSATGAVTVTGVQLCGRLVKAVTFPGSPAPTNNYTITITDANAFDVLTNVETSLASDNSSTTTNETYFFLSGGSATQSLHPVLSGSHSVAVTGAGNSKQGTIILYVQP